MKVIDGVKYYKPREIAKLGLIKNGIDSEKEDSNYVFILKLIKAGKLKARNTSLGNQYSHYIVSEQEIERYTREG